MTGVLENVSNELAAVVERVSAGVVRVEGRRRLPASGIVWSPDGVIVTAHHVVEQEEDTRIGLPDGQSVAATLVGRDPTTDLAVLRADATGLTVPGWADPDSLKVGRLVVALGRPGRSVRATLGIVSALGDSWVTPGGGRVSHYLQTDLVMYPGFSGGPLVDAGGRVLGVNTSALLRGLSIAVPSPGLRQAVETLLSQGRVSRGYLGVGVQPVRLPQALALSTGQEAGLLLVSVAPDSPAEQGGLTLGDVILSLDARPVSRVEDLLGYLSDARLQSYVPVRLVRGGEVREMIISVGERD